MNFSWARAISLTLTVLLLQACQKTSTNHGDPSELPSPRVQRALDFVSSTERAKARAINLKDPNLLKDLWVTANPTKGPASLLDFKSNIYLGMSFLKWLPANFKTSCSASMIQTSWAGTTRYFLISAQHCIEHFGEDDWITVYFSATKDERKALSVDYDSKIHFKRSQTVEFLNHDTFIFELAEREARRGFIHKVAQAKPRIGDLIYIKGFPASESSGAITMACRYSGETVGKSEKSGLFSLLDSSICPFIERPQGASGGTVLNSKGEYLGTLVASPKARVERDYTQIAFSRFECGDKVCGPPQYDGIYVTDQYETDSFVFDRMELSFSKGLLHGPLRGYIGNMKLLEGEFSYGKSLSFHEVKVEF